MNSEKKEPPAPERRIQSSATSFFTTLKERNIIQTLAAFIGGGWLITEIVHWILVDHYHCPEQFIDITIATLLCILICTLTWEWFRGIEKRRRIKVELIIIPLFILATAYLDVRFIQHIGEPEQETVSEPLPDNSIAVLPFVNMSGDPEQEYFSDGISEEIITALSKTSKLFVIARTSSFKYKGKEIDVRTVRRELGVRYVLEGSVRRTEDRLRVTAQLIDALKGHHLWAERYDRDLRDIFAIQDEITMKIITALQVKLTEGERARLMARGTENLEAYLKLLQGRETFFTVTKEGNAEGRRLFEEAIALDPEYAHAYIDLGVTYWMDILLQSTKSPRDSLKRAFECITKAIALDDSNPSAHIQLGFLYGMTKQYDKAIAECERAITIAPNLANGHIWMSMVLTYAGKHEEAVQYAEQGLRLDPFPPVHHLRQMGTAYSRVDNSAEERAQPCAQ
jgi:TolB-like protein